MEDSRNLTILIGLGQIRHFPDRRLLRQFLEDLSHQQFSVFITSPPRHPYYWRRWPYQLRDTNLDHWTSMFDRWSWHHRDWPENYTEWRKIIRYVLRLRRVHIAPHAVAIPVFFGDDESFDLAGFHEFVRVLKPVVIVDLGVGEADLAVVESIPDIKVLNYPEDHLELLPLLHSLTGKHLETRSEPPSAPHELARQAFAERTAEQKRPKITVVYPQAMAPSCWATVEVFLYLSEYRELVEKELRRLQDREELDYSGASTELPKSLPTGCPIRVSLQSDSLRTNPSELSINWYEPYNRLPFRISPKDDTNDEYSAGLDLEIFADDLPVASMRLAIAVNKSVRGEPATSVESEAAWYEDIFASYAREDLELVKHLKERYEALGLYMFIDVIDLRSGTSWRSALFQKIDDSDLFQLFWSDHARQSKFVSIEWKHALQAREVKGGRFIRPVYWHDPIPTVPEELAEINFRKINFVEP